MVEKTTARTSSASGEATSDDQTVAKKDVPVPSGMCVFVEVSS